MHVAHDATVACAIRPRLEILAQAPVPTRFGQFEMLVFRWGEEEGSAPDRAGSEHGTPSPGSSPASLASGALSPGRLPPGALSPDHVALVMGDVAGLDDVAVRVHSECITSEVFGSLKCDCRGQLEEAQAEIARRGAGVVVYLRQEGRGIGLANKIRAYELQSLGHDTVDANRLLSLPDDARDYSAAAAMLQRLGVGSVRLMTNNPLKVAGLEKHGIVVSQRTPALVEANPFSAGYLEAKRLRMGHQLPSRSGLEPLPVAGNDAE